MGVKNKELLSQIKEKKRLKVVFLAIHKSVWKIDPVFKKMLDDPYFEPVILVCPYVQYGKERMLEDLKSAYEYFDSKGYPVISSYREQNDTWVQLKDLKPDILFFTNPHNLTRPEYYEEAYKKYLSVYVPYFFLLTTHGGDQSIYNQYFHNAMWKIFMPHSVSMTLANKTAANKGINCILTGYPACEVFFENSLLQETPNPWKDLGKSMLRVIWAPHHTIESAELQLSNFLLYSEFFKSLVEDYKHSVQWCFKPHPILKSKLYQHRDWGKERTDKYYSFWIESENTQLELGEYTNLFKHSDAMIHDSGSFLAEYVFLRKPVLYLVNEKTKSNLNTFGQDALSCCTHGTSMNDINSFIKNLINSGIELENVAVYQ
jgi:CDP-glycerol glycerophosphotransferase (TagB/SpsB family)